LDLGHDHSTESPTYLDAPHTYYAYDADGNPTIMKDVVNGATIGATYDGLARPTSVSGAGASTIYAYSLGSLGRTDPSGSYTFGLDADGRQSDLQVTPGGASSALAFHWEYNLTGATASITDPTGNVTSYGHDSLGRLSSQSTTGATACSNCVLLTYTHNAAGNKISSTASYAGQTATTTTYAYDALSRITGYTPPTPTQSQTYAWNATPDRTSIQIGTNDPVTTAYDAASRPVTDASHASDANGRVTRLPGSQSGEILTLAWDPLGRLTSATSSLGGTTSYTYDSLDRLVSSTTGEVSTDFAYVGLSDALATVTAGSTVVDVGSDADGSALFEYNVTSGLPTYLGHNDHGDTAFTTDATGALAAQATYDPFGNVSGSPSIPAGIRWQGSWRDSTSGLYYVVARWYDPVSGAFLSQDPVEQSPASPQSRDVYAYAAADPVNLVDPDGRATSDSGHHYVYFSPAVLDTAKVQNFQEPKGWWYICGAGAERVVLAFAANRPATRVWPADSGTAYGYKYNDSTRRAFSWPGGADTLGQGYMMYLAGIVQPPAWQNSGRRGVVTWAGTKIGVTTNGSDIALVDNWEAARRSSSTFPFSAVEFNGRSDTTQNEVAFHTDIQTEIAVYGIPAQVAAAIWKLPSQAAHAHSGGHWIAVVGFDNYYYYYIDTCVGSTGCGEAVTTSGATPNAKVDPPHIYADSYLKGFQNFDGDYSNGYRSDPRYRWTWRISKWDLWNAAKGYGYIKDNGFYWWGSLISW
jgi:RHS repeat-associated protein